jgi:hypothetical protein
MRVGRRPRDAIVVPSVGREAESRVQIDRLSERDRLVFTSPLTSSSTTKRLGPACDSDRKGRACETRTYGVTTCAAGGWYVERTVPIAPSTGWNVTDVGVTESLRIESVTDGGSPTSESARAAASETSF